VISFAETSFLFAFYFPRDASEAAIGKVQGSVPPIRISALVKYEFLQAAWFQVWLREKGQSRGMNQSDVQSGLAAFETDFEQGLWNVAQVDWDGALRNAETLAVNYTPRYGVRALDLLHIAVAQELGVDEFLTFDANQRRIAEAEGMKVLI